MSRSFTTVVLAFAFLFVSAGTQAATLVYVAGLSGAAEAPPNASPGTGFATVTIDTILKTMRVEASFSGLLGTVTAAHIHAATAAPFTGTAGVATTTPTFTGFPGGVTSGVYDHTFDMTLSSSYNPSYITAHGGTTAIAFADLQAGIAAGKAYLNIHSTFRPGGEIRGFLEPAPVPVPAAGWALLLLPAAIGFGRRCLRA